MTFPTVGEIEFFTQLEVREFFGARWKPRAGDCFIDEEGEVSWMMEAIAESMGLAWLLGEPRWFWLPRPDQLIEMLEEKGYCPAFKKRGLAGFLKNAPPYHASASKEDDYQWAEGPTPAIALGKCLMEIG